MILSSRSIYFLRFNLYEVGWEYGMLYYQNISIKNFFLINPKNNKINNVILYIFCNIHETEYRETHTFICLKWVLTIKSSTPRRCLASFSLEGEVLMMVTWCPNALANLTATWPNPPSPMIPTFLGTPVDSSKLLSFMGVYTVIPAHNNGAALSIGRLSGTRTTYLQSFLIKFINTS